MNKLFFKISLFSLIIGASFLGTNMVMASTKGVYTENTRLRGQPSLSGNIIQVVPAQTQVEILGETGEWYNIKFGEKVGWSMKEFVQKVSVAEAQVDEKKNDVSQIVSLQKGEEGVTLFASRIRKTPFVAENIVEVVPLNTRVKILAVRSKWYRIKYNGSKTGWIMAELVGKEMKDHKETNIQFEEVPAEIDLVALNQYWLEKVNALRAKKNLRQLVLDQRWVETATEWAGYMGKKGVSTHTRPDGKTMHQWIDSKGLQFTKRYTEDGWQSNYFTENIAWGIAEPTTEGVKQVLDNTLAFFLAEESYNGDHYRTIYHKDWNSVGLGFSFIPSEYKGRDKVFVAFHYGSLEL